MPKNLVIVESPAKAKTIEGFLGKDYTVKSCYGHIRDLAKGNDAVDIKNGYKPIYEVPSDKKQVVSELKKLAKEAETVWLASDEDREGEAISWHLAEVLKLDEKKTKRIVFHEITKPAIQKAIENPRTIDQHLVDAQQARRILDRLVGFELSPILWRKVKPSLSAGRVQSVAVRLIVEREREINDFEAKSSFKITAIFEVPGTGRTMKAEHPKRFENEGAAQEFLNKCVGADFNIKDIEVKPGKRTPAPPFTTSTLQQEASRKLGFSVSQTMTLAQRLYEAGLITYMRTDSVNLSDLALNAAKKEITDNYGDNYSKTRKYTTKSDSAQEAHEAIRPTYFNRHSVEDRDRNENRLYELIWKRAIASQMSDAVLEKTTIEIVGSKAPDVLQAKGEVIKFDGFLKVYLEGTDDEGEEEESGLLPPVNKGDRLDLNEMTAQERFSRPPARYTEASLVKQLEELGIGRPSTYAPTISTVQKRGYVVKEAREGRERAYRVLTLKNDNIGSKTQTEITGAEKNKLFPSDIGMLVTDFLKEHFGEIMDYGFTASVEKEFDEIAKGLKKWGKMIDNFYNPFHKTVDKTLETADRVTGERELGVHPETGLKIIARMGRYGPMVQMGDAELEQEVKYAGLRNGQSIEQITLEEALDLFKLPRVVGEFEGKEIKAAIGRFGPYLLHNSKFVSITKTSGEDPYTINEEKAIELIEAKRKADAEKFIKSFPEEDIEILNGRWGPYIKQGKNNFKIPKDTDAKKLTLEDTLKLIKEGGTKKTAKKGTTKKGGKTSKK